jgi:hypothetical protein
LPEKAAMFNAAFGDAGSESRRVKKKFLREPCAAYTRFRIHAVWRSVQARFYRGFQIFTRPEFRIP